jgi:CheY-like chemotaxis protein
MSNPLRILIVDDQPANLKLLERALVRDGHQCVLAETGEEAVELFVRETPDLVLMDVMLPGIDGFEATRRIRKHKTERWVPVIFLSALNQSVDIVSGLDAGGDDYLSKPVDLSVLQAKIESGQRFVALHRQIEEQAKYLRRYYDQSEEEKRLATVLMRNLRRENKPRIPGLEFTTTASIDIAGDIIAADETPDGHLYVMLADAIGHGLIAAINLLPAVEAFYHMTSRGSSMPRLISSVNDALREFIPGSRFVCALFASIDPRSGTLEVWNAGMPNALLTTGDGRLLQRFESRMVPLGIAALATEEIESDQCPMAADDVLTLFSDGLVEATNPEGQSFGEEGLLAVLPDALSGDGSSRIMKALRKFAGSSAYADDVSVCLVRQTVASSQHQGLPAFRNTPQDFQRHPSGLTLVFGPQQLGNAEDMTPRFMALAREHCALMPSTYNRIFRAVRELVCNAIDWGLLRLPPVTAQPSKAARLQQRMAALAKLSEGHITLSLYQSADPRGRRVWEVTVTDSGPGFDAQAALAHACSLPCPGGLARVAHEALAWSCDAPGNQIRIWLGD